MKAFFSETVDAQVEHPIYMLIHLIEEEIANFLPHNIIHKKILRPQWLTNNAHKMGTYTGDNTVAVTCVLPHLYTKVLTQDTSQMLELYGQNNQNTSLHHG